VRHTFPQEEVPVKRLIRLPGEPECPDREENRAFGLNSLTIHVLLRPFVMFGVKS
jgi:hypothetical protein